jgi:hypothetical protein
MAQQKITQKYASRFVSGSRNKVTLVENPNKEETPYDKYACMGE